MKIENIPAFEGDHINVIIETPLGSCFKYAYDPVTEVMKVRHQLPIGYFFKFNSGFIPNTCAEDGDPIDVILYSTERCTSGSMVECRVIGALMAKQKKEGKLVRNDRVFAVPSGIKIYDAIRTIGDIDKRILTQYQNFLVSYEKYRGIAFDVIKWISSAQAFMSIRRSVRA